MNRFFNLLLMLCLLAGQTLLPHGQNLVLAASADADHAAMHRHAVPHHHHNDGSWHHEESEESRDHLLTDSCLHTPALATAPLATAIVPATCRPGSGADSGHHPPFLEGIRRPPRSPA